MVLGEGGQAGCYLTICVGGETDTQISLVKTTGVYDHWADFAGESLVFAGGVGLPFTEVGVSVSTVRDITGKRKIGSGFAFSMGVGLIPAQVSGLICSTKVVRMQDSIPALEGKQPEQEKTLLQAYSKANPGKVKPSEAAPTSPAPVGTAKVLPLAANVSASNTKHGYGVPSYAVSDKLVTLSGLVGLKAGAWGVIGTLPPEARPDRIVVFDANTHAGRVRVDVLKDGRVMVHPSTGQIASGWVSLGGLRYAKTSGTALPLVGGAATHSPKHYGKASWFQQGGVVTLGGLLTDSDKGYGHVATLPAGARPDRTHIFNINAHNQNVRLDVHANGQIFIDAKTATAGVPGWVSLAGVSFPTASGETLSLKAGRRSLGKAFGVGTYRRVGDFVYLGGGIVDASQAWGQIATLPAGARPPKILVFPGSKHTDALRVDVTPAGEVIVRPANGVPAHKWISLSNISFYSPVAR